MRFVEKLKCWVRINSEQETDVRRIYIGDVPYITDSGTSINAPNGLLHQTQSVQDAASSMTVESLATSTETTLECNAPDTLRPPPKPPVPVRRSSLPDPHFKPKPQRFKDNIIISSRYTVWNFLIKNLYQQFRRVVNFYFLTVAVIQTLIDSPVTPITALAPLSFVITVTLIKQGYEDYLRHKADAYVNNRLVQVVRNDEVISIKSKEVKVGDILKLDLDDQVPTDLLLLASSDNYQRCQINTANLDGETNLKMRYCPSGIYHFRNERDFKKLHVIVECEHPNADLYQFNGNLLIPSSGSTPASDFLQIPLSMDNIVLRGTRLKNTDYIYGLVVYTGEETRLAQNSKNSSPKYSTVDRSVNVHLMAFIVTLICLIVTFTILHYCVQWYPDTSWYIPGPDIKMGTFLEYFNTLASFLILFNYIIPISLMVAMEMEKFIGSKFFVWDADMAASNGAPPLCNTSDLNEELGQIEYLFSDKTGTLTENIMKFRYCTIQDKRYIFEDNKLHLRDEESNTSTVVDVSSDQAVRKFLTVLALCHTVQLMPVKRHSFDSSAFGPSGILNLKKKQKKISSKLKNASSLFSIETAKPTRRFTVGLGGKWEYQASSPDEKALLEACSKLEIIYYGEKEDVLSVDVCGKIEYFKRHYVLEFDADRKCMSTIIENSDGEIFLLSKGAETTLISNSDDGSAVNIAKHVTDYALMGLRTLVVAEKKLTRTELNDFSVLLKQTRRTIKNREAKMRELYRSAESHLTILGATGVEDQLQAGVPETLQALGAAGIKVWMLTGDKVETGVNVAVACGLITASSKQMMLTNHSDCDEIKRRLTEIQSEMEEGDNTTFVIDGGSLANAFNCCPKLLCDVTMKAFRVVCCRMAPLQKAQVVQMVKKTKMRPVTAAVGDGANDVAMIQEAHIGIGILGKEGRQAARCSDFAVAKFSFLRKAILVHGHWYYARLSVLTNYFFYKNFAFVLPQIFFSFHSAFSTQPIFEGLFLMMYNIFYTSLPIFIYGMLDQDHPAEVLLTKPHLYKKLRRNAYMLWNQFFRWLAAAFWHAVTCYFIPYYAWSAFEPMNGLHSFGTVVFICLVVVINMKMVIEANSITWPYVGSHLFSYLTMIITTSLYSELNADWLFDPGSYAHVYYSVLSSLPFYLTLFCVMAVSLIPDVLFRGFKTSWTKVINTFKRMPKSYQSKRKKSEREIAYTPQGSSAQFHVADTHNQLEPSIA